MQTYIDNICDADLAHNVIWQLQRKAVTVGQVMKMAQREAVDNLKRVGKEMRER
jgi:DNA-binding transcriptional regulator YdaS (Cro superfamily)